MKLQLKEKEKNLLNKNHELCDDTFNEIEVKERMQRFKDCCKSILWYKMEPLTNCTIPGFEELVPKSLELPECSDFSLAARSYDNIGDYSTVFRDDMQRGTFIGLCKLKKHHKQNTKFMRINFQPMEQTNH